MAVASMRTGAAGLKVVSLLLEEHNRFENELSQIRSLSLGSAESSDEGFESEPEEAVLADDQGLSAGEGGLHPHESARYTPDKASAGSQAPASLAATTPLEQLLDWKQSVRASCMSIGGELTAGTSQQGMPAVEETKAGSDEVRPQCNLSSRLTAPQVNETCPVGTSRSQPEKLGEDDCVFPNGQESTGSTSREAEAAAGSGPSGWEEPRSCLLPMLRGLSAAAPESAEKHDAELTEPACGQSDPPFSPNNGSNNEVSSRIGQSLAVKVGLKADAEEGVFLDARDCTHALAESQQHAEQGEGVGRPPGKEPCTGLVLKMPSEEGGQESERKSLVSAHRSAAAPPALEQPPKLSRRVPAAVATTPTPFQMTTRELGTGDTIPSGRPASAGRPFGDASYQNLLQVGENAAANAAPAVQSASRVAGGGPSETFKHDMDGDPAEDMDAAAAAMTARIQQMLERIGELNASTHAAVGSADSGDKDFISSRHLEAMIDEALSSSQPRLPVPNSPLSFLQTELQSLDESADGAASGGSTKAMPNRQGKSSANLPYRVSNEKPVSLPQPAATAEAQAYLQRVLCSLYPASAIPMDSEAAAGGASSYLAGGTTRGPETARLTKLVTDQDSSGPASSDSAGSQMRTLADDLPESESLKGPKGTLSNSVAPFPLSESEQLPSKRPGIALKGRSVREPSVLVSPGVAARLGTNHRPPTTPEGTLFNEADPRTDASQAKLRSGEPAMDPTRRSCEKVQTLNEAEVQTPYETQGIRRESKKEGSIGALLEERLRQLEAVQEQAMQIEEKKLLHQLNMLRKGEELAMRRAEFGTVSHESCPAKAFTDIEAPRSPETEEGALRLGAKRKAADAAASWTTKRVPVDHGGFSMRPKVNKDDEQPVEAGVLLSRAKQAADAVWETVQKLQSAGDVEQSKLGRQAEGSLAAAALKDMQGALQKQLEHFHGVCKKFHQETLEAIEGFSREARAAAPDNKQLQAVMGVLAAQRAELEIIKEQVAAAHRVALQAMVATRTSSVNHGTPALSPASQQEGKARRSFAEAASMLHDWASGKRAGLEAQTAEGEEKRGTVNRKGWEEAVAEAERVLAGEQKKEQQRVEEAQAKWQEIVKREEERGRGAQALVRTLLGSSFDYPGALQELQGLRSARAAVEQRCRAGFKAAMGGEEDGLPIGSAPQEDDAYAAWLANLRREVSGRIAAAEASIPAHVGPQAGKRRRTAATSTKLPLPSERAESEEERPAAAVVDAGASKAAESTDYWVAQKSPVKATPQTAGIADRGKAAEASQAPAIVGSKVPLAFGRKYSRGKAAGQALQAPAQAGGERQGKAEREHSTPAWVHNLSRPRRDFSEVQGPAKQPAKAADISPRRRSVRPKETSFPAVRWSQRALQAQTGDLSEAGQDRKQQGDAPGLERRAADAAVHEEADQPVPAMKPQPPVEKAAAQPRGSQRARSEAAVQTGDLTAAFDAAAGAEAAAKAKAASSQAVVAVSGEGGEGGEGSQARGQAAEGSCGRQGKAAPEAGDEAERMVAEVSDWVGTQVLAQVLLAQARDTQPAEEEAGPSQGYGRQEGAREAPLGASTALLSAGVLQVAMEGGFDVDEQVVGKLTREALAEELQRLCGKLTPPTVEEALVALEAKLGPAETPAVGEGKVKGENAPGEALLEEVVLELVLQELARGGLVEASGGSTRRAPSGLEDSLAEILAAQKAAKRASPRPPAAPKVEPPEPKPAGESPPPQSPRTLRSPSVPSPRLVRGASSNLSPRLQPAPTTGPPESSPGRSLPPLRLPQHAPPLPPPLPQPASAVAAGMQMPLEGGVLRWPAAGAAPGAWPYLPVYLVADWRALPPPPLAPPQEPAAAGEAGGATAAKRGARERSWKARAQSRKAAENKSESPRTPPTPGTPSSAGEGEGRLAAARALAGLVGPTREQPMGRRGAEEMQKGGTSSGGASQETCASPFGAGAVAGEDTAVVAPEPKPAAEPENAQRSEGQEDNKEQEAQQEEAPQRLSSSEAGSTKAGWVAGGRARFLDERQAAEAALARMEGKLLQKGRRGSGTSEQSSPTVHSSQGSGSLASASGSLDSLSMGQIPSGLEPSSPATAESIGGHVEPPHHRGTWSKRTSKEGHGGLSAGEAEPGGYGDLEAGQVPIVPPEIGAPASERSSGSISEPGAVQAGKVEARLLSGHWSPPKPRQLVRTSRSRSRRPLPRKDVIRSVLGSLEEATRRRGSASEGEVGSGREVGEMDGLAVRIRATGASPRRQRSSGNMLPSRSRAVEAGQLLPSDKLGLEAGELVGGVSLSLRSGIGNSRDAGEIVTSLRLLQMSKKL